MLRITTNLENDGTVRLRLDGNVTMETFAELASLCAPYQHSGQTLILDMTGVNFMNHDAAERLAGMRNDSLRIINCSLFVAAVLDMVKNSTNSSPRH